MAYKRILGLFVAMVLMASGLRAQGWLGRDLVNMSARDLTASQQEELLRMAKQNGYNESDLEALARSQGLQMPNATPLAIDKKTDDTLAKNSRVQEDNQLQSQVAIYGQELFENGPSAMFGPSSSLAPPADYIIGPSDRLGIRVFGLQELSVEVRVQNNGFVSVPHVGEVALAGLTLGEAQKLLVQKLRKMGFASLVSGQSELKIHLQEMRSIQVLFWGAKQSGAYDLPGIASAFHAIYAAGGPGSNRTYRSIQVLRAGQVVSTIDLYAYLNGGDRSADITLRDNDILYFPYYDHRVRLRGEVKTPAIFELLPGETLANAFEFAGGFTEIAFKENIEVLRYGAQMKELYTVSFEQLASFEVLGAEIATVSSVLDQIKSRIKIEGAVYRPGFYSAFGGLNLAEALKLAGGLLPTALRQSVLVYSNPENGQRSYRNYPLTAVLSGAVTVTLLENDEVYVLDSATLYQIDRVGVYGNVLNPGAYEYGEGLSAAGLLFRAGGFGQYASTGKVLISRKIQDEQQLATVFSQTASRDFWNNAELNAFLIQPGDIISVFTNPLVNDQVYVSCEGQFKQPGAYPLESRDQSLWDVYEMAGGANGYASLKNMVLIRPRPQSVNDQIIMKTAGRIRNELYENDSLISEGNKQLVQLYDTIALYPIKSKLATVMKNTPATSGDRLILPAMDNMVYISGAVQNATAVVFDRRLSLSDYVDLAGGASEFGDSRRVYAIYPNGRSVTMGYFLGLAKRRKIEPGSRVVVPFEKGYGQPEEKLSTAERITLLSVLGTTLSTMTLVLIQLLP